MSEKRHQRSHTGWVHLYSNRDKINPSEAIRLEIVGSRGWGMGGESRRYWRGKGMRELAGVLKYTISWSRRQLCVCTHVCVFTCNNLNCCLKSAHLTVSYSSISYFLFFLFFNLISYFLNSVSSFSFLN